MANCPNCKTKIPILKIMGLTEKRDLLECDTCKKVLYSNIGLVLPKLVLIGFLGSGLLMIAKKLKANYFEFSLIFGFLGIGTLILAIIYFFKKIELRVYMTELNDADTVYENLERKEKEEAFNSLVKQYKIEYSNYNKSQLIEITSDEGWQPEARQAAKELLQENFNFF